uniref:Uncharacterized protein n=1 Tax=Tanacetum cinerariifolium TaxID=118510 RepID=A0A699KT19_TANCI|nr:hypothetical protein [Tanacetum cinerariifolium]
MEKKDEQATTAQIPVNATIEFVEDTNFDMDFSLEIPTNSPTTVEMVNATKESFDEDDLAKFQELLLDAEKPLYKGCPDFKKLSAIVKLLNLKGKYGASDKFFTELLGLLKKMLRAGNKIVEKTYQAKKLMRMIGSGYKKIHVCSNNCILYWKDNKELSVCPTCEISRWKVDNKTHKLYENIPAKAWRTIDEKFLEIAKDPRNLRLGISADEVDVNSGTRHHKKNVCESLVGTLLNVPGKTKEGMNARLDLAELEIKPELFARQEEDKTTLPPAGYTLTNAK